LLDRIEEINLVINIVESIQHYESFLNEFKKSINEKDYVKCINYLSKLAELTNESTLFKGDEKVIQSAETDESEKAVQIYKVKQLREEFVVQRERLWFELDQEWDRLIDIELKNKDDSAAPPFLRINGSITQSYLDQLTRFSKFKSTNLTKQTTTANHTTLFLFNSKMKQFAKKFLQLCQQNIISNCEQSPNEIEILNEGEDIKLTFKPQSSKAINSSKSSKNKQQQQQQQQQTSQEKSMENGNELLKSKFKQLETILRFLNEHLFKYSVPLLNANASGAKTTSLMAIFSDTVLDDFTRLIYEQLVINIIPISSFDFSLEEKIYELVGAFEQTLVELKFYTRPNKSTAKSYVFRDFVRNVEELYVRKKCKHIMETGRELMKRNDLIFEVVRVSENNRLR